MPAWIYSEEAYPYFHLLSKNLKELAKLMQHSRQLTANLPEDSTIQSKYQAVVEFFGPDVFDLPITTQNIKDLAVRQKENTKKFKSNPFLMAISGFYKTLMNQIDHNKNVYHVSPHSIDYDHFAKLHDLIQSLNTLIKIKNKGLTEYSSTIDSLCKNISILLNTHLLGSLSNKKDLKETPRSPHSPQRPQQLSLSDSSAPSTISPLVAPLSMSAYGTASPGTRARNDEEMKKNNKKIELKRPSTPSPVISAISGPTVFSPLKPKVTPELLKNFHKKMNVILHKLESEERSETLIDFSDEDCLLPFPLEASILIAKVENRIEELNAEINQGNMNEERKVQKIEALKLLIELVRTYPHQSFSIIEFVRETYPVLDKGGIFAKSATSQLLNELSITSVKFHIDSSLSSLARKNIEDNNKQITRLTTEMASVFSLHHATKQEKIKVLLRLNQQIVEIDKTSTDQNRESDIQNLKLQTWQSSASVLDKTFLGSNFRISTTTKTLFPNYRTVQIHAQKRIQNSDDDEVSSPETSPETTPVKSSPLNIQNS